MDTNYISIPESVADELLGLGDGDAALLYLFIASRGGESAPEDAAKSFGWGSPRLRAASDKLLTLIAARARETGTKQDTAAVAAPEPVPVPEGAGRTLSRREPPDAHVEADRRQWHALVMEAQRMFGRALSSDDLIRLLGIYNNLKLPTEVILQLIRYCMTETRRRGGEGGAPTMRGIEKEAFIWEREGIFSIEAAERYIKEREAQYGEIELIKKTLQIGGRELAPTERKYIESWTALGFGAEEAAIAYDRTMTQTGRLAWGYMDSIMNSWHAKGLRTAAEINERDKRADKPLARSKAAGRARSRPAPGSGELERMRELLSGIGGRDGAAKDGD